MLLKKETLTAIAILFASQLTAEKAVANNSPVKEKRRLVVSVPIKFKTIDKLLEYKRIEAFEGKAVAKAFYETYQRNSFLVDAEGSSIQFINASNITFAEIGGYAEGSNNGYLSFKTKQGSTFTEVMSLSSGGLLTATAFKASLPLPIVTATDYILTIANDGTFKRISAGSLGIGTGNYVSKTGNETIEGIKSFSSNVGIGTATPAISTVSQTIGRKVLTILGDNNASVIEMASSVADANGTQLGQIAFTTPANTAGTLEKRVAIISGVTDGATPNDRGGALLFNTKKNAGFFYERMRINSEGNVGVGTSNPISRFHLSDGNNISSNLYFPNEPYTNTISAENNPAISNIVAASSTVYHRGVFKATRSRGTLSSPLPIAPGDYTVSLLGSGYDGTSIYYSAGITCLADAPVSTGIMPQGIIFETGQNTRTERMRITSNGNVGINTTSPVGKLHLVSDGLEVPSVIDWYSNTATNAPGIISRKARGTPLAPAAVQNGDAIGGLFAAPHNGTSFNTNSTAIRFFTSENVTSTSNGSSLTLETTLNGSNTRQIRMRVENDGKIGINTSLTEARLHIKSEGLEAASLAESYSDVANISAGHLLRKSRGTIASPLAVQNGDAIGGGICSTF